MSGPVSTGMGDCHRTSKPPRHVTSHPGQLRIGQNAMMLCDCTGTKAAMAHMVQIRGDRETAGMTFDIVIPSHSQAVNSLPDPFSSF